MADDKRDISAANPSADNACWCCVTREPQTNAVVAVIVGAMVVARSQLSLGELIGNGLDLHALVTRGSLEYFGEMTDVLVREFM